MQPWAIANRRHKTVSDKQIKNGTHSLSLRNGQSSSETSCCLFVLWKTVVMLGKLGDLPAHKSEGESVLAL